MMGRWQAISTILLITLLLLFIAGCTPEPTVEAVGPYPGALAPDFRAKLLDGSTLDLADLHGRPVILNFWASWCGPCLREMPLIQTIHDNADEQRLSVVAVNYGEDRDTVAGLVEEEAYTFPVILDPDRDFARIYLVQGMPTTYFIDGDGIIQWIHVGEMNGDLLYSYKTALLQR